MTLWLNVNKINLLMYCFNCWLCTPIFILCYVCNQESKWKTQSRRNSAVSRAILKPVYRFGIPNSDPQTLKSVDFQCKLSSPFVVAEPRERCFVLSKMQNSQNFPGLCPWTILRKRLTAPPDSPVTKLFSRYAGRITGTPKKVLDTAPFWQVLE